MSTEHNYNVGHVIMVTLSAAIGGFLFGFDSSVINGANVALKGYFNCNDMQLGLAVSLALIGAAVGAYFAGRLADKFGRVRCMIAASILFFVSAIGSGLPFTIYDFIAWRVIGGVGIGVASIIAPIYIAETSPAHLRGRLELHHRPHFRFCKQLDYGSPCMESDVLGRSRSGTHLRHRRLAAPGISALPRKQGLNERSQKRSLITF